MKEKELKYEDTYIDAIKIYIEEIEDNLSSIKYNLEELQNVIKSN